MDKHTRFDSIIDGERSLPAKPSESEGVYAFVRPSARVARVAALLDMHAGDIRRMVKKGELEAHGKGIRGMRVYLDSVRDFQERRTRPSSNQPDLVSLKPKVKARVHSGAFQDAMAGLRAKGLA